MEVTNIKIYPCKRGGMVALVDIVLDDGLAINELHLVKGKRGLHVQYPASQSSSTNVVRHICKPINKETQLLIEAAVIAAFEKEQKNEQHQ